MAGLYKQSCKDMLPPSKTVPEQNDWPLNPSPGGFSQSLRKFSTVFGTMPPGGFLGPPHGSDMFRSEAPCPGTVEPEDHASSGLIANGDVEEDLAIAKLPYFFVGLRALLKEAKQVHVASHQQRSPSQADRTFRIRITRVRRWGLGRHIIRRRISTSTEKQIARH